MKLYVEILYSTSAYNVRIWLNLLSVNIAIYLAIGPTVVNKTCCDHTLSRAANLLCEATWSFPKMAFCMHMNLLCAATYIKMPL